MRISTQYQFASYASNISEAQSRYLAVQNQISTGKRLINPSDDPTGASMVLSYNSLKGAAERYTKNIEYGRSFLKFSENALTQTQDIMRRAYQLAVQGANGATTQEGRDGMVQEINTIQQQLIEYGNSRGPNGSFIFAGQRTDQKPFTYALGVPSYQGDNQNLSVETAPGEVLQINTDGSTLFMDAWNRLESLKTNLQGGNTGAISGIDIGAIQTSMDQITLERGRIGTKLQQADRLVSDYGRRIDELRVSASDIEEVDMSKAIVELQMSQSAYEAALSVASQGFRLSLMDYIRG